jgi:hypothetical protein
MISKHGPTQSVWTRCRKMAKMMGNWQAAQVLKPLDAARRLLI